MMDAYLHGSLRRNLILVQCVKMPEALRIMISRPVYINHHAMSDCLSISHMYTISSSDMQLS